MATVIADLTYASAGNYEVTASADVGDAIEELDETNNNETISLNVS
ncbi:hypothetical protein HY497_02095 [Candidatus Woesearchaeota archaeon]|nr:hypothetical protein [Candidatus Woesearchaeota archaeon]